MLYCSVDFDFIGFQSPYKPHLGGQTSNKSVVIRNRMKTAKNKAKPNDYAVLEGCMLLKKESSGSTQPRNPKGKLKIHIDVTEANVIWAPSPPTNFFGFLETPSKTVI